MDFDDSLMGLVSRFNEILIIHRWFLEQDKFNFFNPQWGINLGNLIKTRQTTL